MQKLCLECAADHILKQAKKLAILNIAILRPKIFLISFLFSKTLDSFAPQARATLNIILHLVILRV